MNDNTIIDMIPSSIVCKFRREPCELDRAIHVKYSPALSTSLSTTASTTNDEQGCAPSEPKAQPLRGLAAMSPSERFELKKFEQKYRACTSETEHCDGAASSLVDDLYHDDCLHFLDGIPMNKSALAQFHKELIRRGTKRRVVEFNVIDSTHLETVILCSEQQRDLYVRCAITLKDGKIYRVKKLQSALPPPLERKFSGAMAA